MINMRSWQYKSWNPLFISWLAFSDLNPTGTVAYCPTASIHNVKLNEFHYNLCTYITWWWSRCLQGSLNTTAGLAEVLTSFNHATGSMMSWAQSCKVRASPQLITLTVERILAKTLSAHMWVFPLTVWSLKPDLFGRFQENSLFAYVRKIWVFDMFLLFARHPYVCQQQRKGKHNQKGLNFFL